MRKIIFYLFLINAVLACKSNKNSSALQYEDLNLEAAFIQKEIPGTQGEKTKTYITILFSELISDKVKLEKLHFVGDVYAIQSTDYRDEKTVKIDVTKSDFWNKSSIPQVKLYYTVAKKSVVQEITSTIKEPIYLP